jgi:uncharacterized protein YceK
MRLRSFGAMTKRRKTSLLVLALLFLMGLPFSATVQTVREESMHPSFIYKGVLVDLTMIFLPMPWQAKARGFIDLPVSAVADTLFLPYTIYRTVTEPRKVAVWFLSNEDGGPGFVLQSDLPQEDRRPVSLAEVCSVLNSISGKPRSVDVVVSPSRSVSVGDFGVLYETVASNETLKWVYWRNAIEPDLLAAYLADKASRKTMERTGTSRPTSSAAGSSR